MTVIELLNPPECDTEKGRGWAHWLIDYGPHGNVLFGVVLNDTGQLWWVPTNKLTIAANWSLGQHGTKKIPEGRYGWPGVVVPTDPAGPGVVLDTAPIGPKTVLLRDPFDRPPRGQHCDDH